MLLSYDEFQSNTAAVLATIREACRQAGRNPTEVSLLPVTKTHPAEAVDYVRRHGGLPAVGENRVQEAAEKRPLTSGGLRWELIGHLQSNKARQAVEVFDRIQSVDSEKLVGVLAKAASTRSAPYPILLQINAGLDPAKFG
ncbi:MAG TPA: alanine racemase, partial [Opitutaceae bacterium]|nr:alanine racemase [Opitutaceae bacterium]